MKAAKKQLEKPDGNKVITTHANKETKNCAFKHASETRARALKALTACKDRSLGDGEGGVDRAIQREKGSLG